MSIILRALREARGMIETERAAFVDCHTLPNGGLEPDDQAIRQEYDDVLALIRDAVEAAESAQPVGELWQHNETGKSIPLLRDDSDVVVYVRSSPTWHMIGSLYLHPPGQHAARPLSDWHEDNGAVVWWRFPVDEPAWIGTPLDDDWPGYHTHWTPHPPVPEVAR